MDKLEFRLKARGEFLKIVLLLLAAFFIYQGLEHLPTRYVLLLMKKRHVLDLSFLKSLSLLALGLTLSLALYLILLMKTTRLELGKVNLNISKGLFLRREDALNITAIQDVRKERSLLDMLLGLSKVIVFSKDPTDPKLKIRGLAQADADLFYEHVVLYSNRNMVEFMQGQSERRAFSKKQKLSKDPEWKKGLFDDSEEDN